MTYDWEAMKRAMARARREALLEMAAKCRTRKGTARVWDGRKAVERETDDSCATCAEDLENEANRST